VAVILWRSGGTLWHDAKGVRTIVDQHALRVPRSVPPNPDIPIVTQQLVLVVSLLEYCKEQAGAFMIFGYLAPFAGWTRPEQLW
jgi:hypothetical protein